MKYIVFVFWWLAYFTEHNVLRFIHVVACVRMSFLYKAEYYSIYVYVTLYFSSPPSEDSCFFHLLPIVNNAAMTWVCIYFFRTRLPIILNIYLEEELLDHMVLLFLIFWGTRMLFSKAFVLFYRHHTGFQFLHILTSLTLIFYLLAILISVRLSFIKSK